MSNKLHLKGEFLKKLPECWTISHTAKAVGVTRGTVYQWRKNDVEFDRAFKEADEEVTDDLRKIVQEIARGMLEKCSVPRLNMIFFELKRRDPTYRETYKHEHDIGDRLAAVLERIQKARET